MLIEHRLSPKKGTIVMLAEHYAPLGRGTATTYVVLAEQFLARFPHHAAFLEGLVARHKLSPAAPLRAIMELATLYDPTDLERAFALAHEYATYSPGFVRGLLESGDRPAVAAAAADPPRPIERALPTAAVRADLRPYQQLLGVTR